MTIGWLVTLETPRSVLFEVGSKGIANVPPPPSPMAAGAASGSAIEDAIETAVDEIIAANPDQVAKAQANPKLAGWFVGQVMKATGGKANPKAVNELVAKKLAL